MSERARVTPDIIKSDFKYFSTTKDSVNTFSKIRNKTKVLADCSLKSGYTLEAHMGLLPLVWLPAKVWGWR